MRVEKYYSTSLECESEGEAVKKRYKLVKFISKMEKYKNIKIIRIFDMIQFIGNKILIENLIKKFFKGEI